MVSPVHRHGDGFEKIPGDRLSRDKGQAVFGSLFLVRGGDLKEPVPDFEAGGVAVLFLIRG